MESYSDSPPESAITRTHEESPELNAKSTDGVDGQVQPDTIDEGKGPECAQLIMLSSKFQERVRRSKIEILLRDENTRNYESSDGDTLLHFIRIRTPLSIVKLLVESGVPKDSRNCFGDTPLVKALKHSNLEVAQYLIDLGVDINLRDLHIGSLPHLLCHEGYFDELKLLVEAGADIYANQQTHGSLLDAALSTKTSHLELVTYLVDDLGFDVNAKVSRFPYPIIGAASMCRKGDGIEKEILDLIISRGADIKMADEEGRQAIHWVAALSTCSDSLESLVAAGADVNAEDCYGRRPIHFAACRSLETASYLLEKGADAHVLDDDGWTPLMWAARSGQTSVMEQLVDRGADLWARGRGFDSEWSALKLALFWNSYPCEEDVPIRLLTPEIHTRQTADGTEKWDPASHNTLPSLHKESDCASCLMQVIGNEWKCNDCPGNSYVLCFKCYRHKSTLHDPNHRIYEYGLQYDPFLTNSGLNRMKYYEVPEDKGVKSVEDVKEALESDDESLVEVEEYDDCDVSVFDNDSVCDDTEWMMLYQERTIKI